MDKKKYQIFISSTFNEIVEARKIPPVGKTKRVRSTLIRSLEEFPERAERFAFGIISLVKANGGFRQESTNYVGKDVIDNLVSILKPKGILLGYDGTLSPVTLEGLSLEEFTEALDNYIARAKKGMEDAALVVGTGKDFMEAVAAHVLLVKMGLYPQISDKMLKKLREN